MFERYSEAARRSIFFARGEAGRAGSAFIDAEHLLLGLLQADPDLLAGNASPDDLEALCAELAPPVGQALPDSQDLPISHELKRVLAYGAEEAEKLKQRTIGTRHLVLGLLRESESRAARILQEWGLELEAFRHDLAHNAVAQDAGTGAERERLHALVDDLPDKSLAAVKQILDSFHVQWARPQAGLGGGGYREVSSSSRIENGATVIETHFTYRGREITETKRLRVSEDGKKLTFSQEIRGPKQEQWHEHSIDFDVS
jgi:hypothetical protein